MDSNRKGSYIAKFIAYFIFGIFVGLSICLIGGFFHDAPKMMLKETTVLSLVVGLISAFWGHKALDIILKFFRF